MRARWSSQQLEEMRQLVWQHAVNNDELRSWAIESHRYLEYIREQQLLSAPQVHATDQPDRVGAVRPADAVDIKQ